MISMWTTLKRASGVGYEERGAVVCLCNFARWHCIQEQVQRRILELISGHTNREGYQFLCGPDAGMGEVV